jgi:hypothetical protein
MSKKSRRPKRKPRVGIQQTVQRLRIAADAMKASRSRYAAYTFLLAVYQFYWQWLDRGCAERHVKALRRQQRKKNQHPVKMLIAAANCSLEAKVMSRWSRALEYALSGENDPTELIDLFRQNGGIAGCARLAAKEDPKRAPSRDDWA